MSSEKSKIVFFNSSPGVIEFAQLEKSIMSSFDEKEFEIIRISCSGTFQKFCTYMNSVDLDYNSSKAQKYIACKSCNNIRLNNLLNSKVFSEHTIEDYLLESDSKVVSEIMDSDNIDIDFGYDNIDFGRFALYEILMKYKCGYGDVLEKYYDHFKSNIVNCLYTYLSVSRFLLDIKPDKVFVYNSNYSINRVLVQMCINLGVDYLTFQHGTLFSNYNQSFSLGSKHTLAFDLVKNNDFENFSEISLSQKDHVYIREHINSIRYGRSRYVFSPKIRQKVSSNLANLSGKYKSTVTILLSSDDEILAADLNGAAKINKNNLYFEDQNLFVEFILDLAINSPELFFIIRLHPRQFSNFRSKFKSTSADVIMNLSRKAGDNVYFDAPSASNSIFEIASMTDIAINYASSSGLEFLSLGIPVINVEPEMLYMYPASLGIELKDTNYIKDFILNSTLDLDFDYIQKSFSWYYYYFRFFEETFPKIVINPGRITKFKDSLSKYLGQNILIRNLTFFIFRFSKFWYSNKISIDDLKFNSQVKNSVTAVTLLSLNSFKDLPINFVSHNPKDEFHYYLTYIDETLEYLIEFNLGNSKLFSKLINLRNRLENLH